MIDFLEQVSFSIIKPTVIILDNARIHTVYKIKERLEFWQKRGSASKSVGQMIFDALKLKAHEVQ